MARLWIDLDSGTYGDAKNVVIVDDQSIAHIDIDSLSDSEIVEIGEQYGKHAITVWAVGRNQPGYSPESEPATFSSWQDARDYLISDMREYADSDDESNDESLPEDAADDDYGTMRADVDSVLRDDPPAIDSEWEWTFTKNDGWPINFWISKSND